MLLGSPGDKKPLSEAVAEYLEGRKKYEDLRKQKRHKSSSREEQVTQYTAIDFLPLFLLSGRVSDAGTVSLLFLSSGQTLALLNQFKTKLTSAISEAPEQEVENQEEEEEDNDKGW